MFLQGKVLSSGSRFNMQMKFVLQSVAAKTSPVLFGINRFFLSRKNFCCWIAMISSGMWINILYIGQYSSQGFMIDAWFCMFTSLNKMLYEVHDHSVVLHVYKCEKKLVKISCAKPTSTSLNK